MSKQRNLPNIPLSRDWPCRVKSAMFHVISLAQFATAYTSGWAVNSQVARVRLKAENDQLIRRNNRWSNTPVGAALRGRQMPSAPLRRAETGRSWSSNGGIAVSTAVRFDSWTKNR